MNGRIWAVLVACTAVGPLAAQATPPQPRPPAKPAPGARNAPATPPAPAARPAAPGARGAVPAAPAAPPPVRPDSAKRDTTPVPAQPLLLREVFAYEGGGRDPFLSLLRSGDIRPLLSDLRLVGVYYDGRYPTRSVAVLRDLTNNHVYKVKPGEIVGRLKVTTIRPREIVFTVQEFGFERQETLQLAKQEVTP